MAFIIRCTFKPGGAEARFAIRVSHIEYMVAALPFTLIGGPRISDGPGASAAGMMVVVDLPDQAAAERFIENEPYRKAGLFNAIEIEPFKVMTEDVLRVELAREQAKAQS